MTILKKSSISLNVSTILGKLRVMRYFKQESQRTTWITCLNGMALLMAFILLVQKVPMANAEIVTVTGRAELIGSLSFNREQAIKDGIRQASLMRKLEISSYQQTQFGELVDDQLNLVSHSQVKGVEILSERQSKDEYQVKLQVELEEQPVCKNHSRHYRKTVAMTGFKLVNPLQASIGRLESIEQSAAKYLIQKLSSSTSLQILDVSSNRLHSNAELAPTARDQFASASYSTPSTQSPLATQLGAQFVVTGVIRSMQLSYSQAIGKRFLRAIQMEEPTRQFVLDLYIYDGFSGALLSQKTLSTSGRWSFKRRPVGTDSPYFWSSHYGRQIVNVLQQAQEMIEQEISCQPFMARISRTRGHRIHIDATASSNIRAGDELQVYRSGDRYDGYFSRQRQLTAMGQVATVKQVQPHFIIADLPLSGENLAIQQDDIVIIW